MADWDEVADSYENTHENTTRAILERHLALIGPGEGMRVADIAAGPGVITLGMALAGAEVTASDYSAAMIRRLAQRVTDAGLASRVTAFVSDAQSLALRDNAVDAAVSNFGIIFCPDVDRALREMARVAQGTLTFSAWTTEARNGWTFLLSADYVDRLGFELPPRTMFKWASIDELRAACLNAGWSTIDAEVAVAEPTRFPSWDAVGDVCDSPASRESLSSLSEEQKDKLRRFLEGQAREVFGDGEVVLPREAWFAHGRAR